MLISKLMMKSSLFFSVSFTSDIIFNGEDIELQAFLNIIPQGNSKRDLIPWTILIELVEILIPISE